VAVARDTRLVCTQHGSLGLESGVHLETEELGYTREPERLIIAQQLGPPPAVAKEVYNGQGMVLAKSLLCVHAGELPGFLTWSPF
jgi:hypothetical protein